MRERLKRHAFDGFSFLAGLVFVVVGVLVAVDTDAGRDVRPEWIVAMLLVGLGLAGVLGSIDWSRSGGGDGGPDPLDALDGTEATTVEEPTTDHPER
jgi:hypothetical protein